jgi:glyoxylase I family protein
MLKVVEELLTKYENGSLGRRELVAVLSAMFVTPAVTVGQSETAPIRVRTLNHVSLSVADVERSVEFYQKLFGMSVKSRDGSPGSRGFVINLAPGPGPEFIGIYHTDKSEIDHFCLGVENFNADTALKALTERGVKARMITRGETKEIFLTDPDGISVQLTDSSYCRGSGSRGDKC